MSFFIGISMLNSRVSRDYFFMEEIIMILINEGNTYNIPLQTYYIESEEELLSIPDNAPAGTLVECNATNGFSVYMKNTEGVFNKL